MQLQSPPVPEVVTALRRFTSLHALWPYLPTPFAEDVRTPGTTSGAVSAVRVMPGQQQ